MSTKIYDAYKYHGKIEELPEVLHKIMIEFANGGEFKRILMGYNNPYEIINLKRGEKETKYLKDISNIWDFQDFLETKEGKAFKEDFDLVATVHFDKGNIYCMFFNVPYRLIESNELFTDYHYQDSSDMSNYDEREEPWRLMTEERIIELEKEWDNRRDTWDRIFDYSWSPKTAGFTYGMSPFEDMQQKRVAFKIFKDELNNPVLLRKIKIKRLRYVMKHKVHIDKIEADGGGVTDISKYCRENGIKLSDISN